MAPYLERSLEPVLKKAANQFPAVVLTGPRQAGKTTLLKHLFGTTHRYVSLEPPDVRASAEADPRGFLELFAAPVIFDEIQHAPNLLFYIKEKIDENRSLYGQFILTGSQNLLLSNHVAETLAGRAATLRLLPLSYTEMIGSPQAPFVWEHDLPDTPKHISQSTIWQMMLRGSYPELTEHPEKDFHLWQSSYMQTYLERDVRSLRQVGDLTQFQLFLRAVAARSGQLFQVSDVARDLGLSVNTIKAWLGILEATYQILILRPYFSNSNKRLVKTPKVYFTDVGTLCYLCGLSAVEPLRAGPMAGAVIETFVISEVFKRLSNRGSEPQIYFYRTSQGTEVDLLIEQEGQLIPVEIKATATPQPKMASGICSLDMKKVGKGYLLHLGEMSLPLAKNVLALPLTQL